MKRTTVQATTTSRRFFAGRTASLACVLALCMAPLGLSACSGSNATNEQAVTSQEAQAETAATTEATEEVQPIYAVTKMSYSYDGITTSRTCTYDDSGNCTSNVYDVAGESETQAFHRETTTEYDEQGAPISQNMVSTSSESSEESSSTFETTLDDDGYLTALVETAESYSVTWAYSYDAEGRLTSTLATNSTDETSATSEWAFNEYGWVTEEAYDAGTDDAISITYSYEGDDPAHPTTATVTTSYSPSMGIEDQTNSYVLAYDENGNVVTVEGTGEYEGSVWTYEYQKVENPSAIATTEASLKVPGGGMSLF